MFRAAKDKSKALRSWRHSAARCYKSRAYLENPDYGAMGFASTLVVNVTRCASNCSLHNLVASLYDRVLLSDMRLVMHMTNWRLAETGREFRSAAGAT